ncbi:MAG: YiiX/YebB-like N1pC/P60 family cysteine hydrolase, partial [Chloroflexota bacterium]
IYEPAAAHCPELTAPTGIHNPILQAQLQPGDIVLSRIDLSDCPVTEVFCHAYQLYDGYWMHAGIVTHTDGEPGLVEATNPGGVAHRPLSNTSLSDDITVIRVNAPLEVRRAAADYALSMVGSPFSKDYYDKSRTDAFYCSQLIWAAYQSVNIDLDSNYLLTDATFTARFDASPLMQAMVMQYADGGVTPDDLLVSEHTTQIYH